jgi:hypothetical protein
MPALRSCWPPSPSPTRPRPDPKSCTRAVTVWAPCPLACLHDDTMGTATRAPRRRAVTRRGAIAGDDGAPAPPERLTQPRWYGRRVAGSENLSDLGPQDLPVRAGVALGVIGGRLERRDDRD